MIVEQDISQADLEGLGAVVVPADKGPARGWKIVESLDWASIREQSDAMKAKALGISEAFLRGESTIETMPPQPPIYIDSLNTFVRKVTENMKAKWRRDTIFLMRPRAVRGGAKLHTTDQKFRSLRLARLWWKANMVNNPDFDIEPYMPKGRLGTMLGTTMITEPKIEILHESVTPGVIPHYHQTTLITDTYRKPNNE